MNAYIFPIFWPAAHIHFVFIYKSSYSLRPDGIVLDSCADTKKIIKKSKFEHVKIYFVETRSPCRGTGMFHRKYSTEILFYTSILFCYRVKAETRGWYLTLNIYMASLVKT